MKGNGNEQDLAAFATRNESRNDAVPVAFIVANECTGALWLRQSISAAWGSRQREATFAVRAAKESNMRPVSAIDIDAKGIVYAASATDPGDDGPFRSIVWQIGRVHADDHGQPVLSLESRPRRLATVDGLKVEGLAVRRIAGRTQIVIGSDDEAYGGVVRPLPH